MRPSLALFLVLVAFPVSVKAIRHLTYGRYSVAWVLLATFWITVLLGYLKLVGKLP